MSSVPPKPTRRVYDASSGASASRAPKALLYGAAAALWVASAAGLVGVSTFIGYLSGSNLQDWVEGLLVGLFLVALSVEFLLVGLALAVSGRAYDA